MINKLVGAKLPIEEAQIFKDFCTARGENVSSVLRRLILTELAKYSYLESDRKKALGLLGGGEHDGSKP